MLVVLHGFIRCTGRRWDSGAESVENAWDRTVWFGLSNGRLKVYMAGDSSGLYAGCVLITQTNSSVLRGWFWGQEVGGKRGGFERLKGSDLVVFGCFWRSMLQLLRTTRLGKQNEPEPAGTKRIYFGE